MFVFDPYSPAVDADPFQPDPVCREVVCRRDRPPSRRLGGWTSGQPDSGDNRRGGQHAQQ